MTGRSAPGRLTPDGARSIAVGLRTAVPLVQVRQVGRIAQEMADPDLAQLVRALARLAAEEVDLPDGYMAAPTITAGPGWWASLVVAETVNDRGAWTGTLLALLAQPTAVVAQVMVRLLSPSGLVRGVQL
ncbi:MAG: hypothetical protein FWH11_01415 [Micrococcales bacterium]|nr:hypothetical protein [Micrococcales bacterium]